MQCPADQESATGVSFSHWWSGISFIVFHLKKFTHQGILNSTLLQTSISRWERCSMASAYSQKSSLGSHGKIPRPQNLRSSTSLRPLRGMPCVSLPSLLRGSLLCFSTSIIMDCEFDCHKLLRLLPGLTGILTNIRLIHSADNSTLLFQCQGDPEIWIIIQGIIFMYISYHIIQPLRVSNLPWE